LDGITTVKTSTGRSLKVYRLDHPEWIGIYAPAERLHGVILTLEEIGRVYEVEVHTEELRRMLQTRSTKAEMNDPVASKARRVVNSQARVRKDAHRSARNNAIEEA